MLSQAIDSLIVGGAISVVMFIPVLIWQYRSYGAFQPARTLWTVITFVYVTALITYTLFPLPDMTGDFCANHPQVYVLDPRIYFQQMAQELAGLGWFEVLLSWEVLQMVFNVALFVPLGVILSDFVVIKARWGVPLGLGVSLLIETTQFTGNWGLMPCAYRVADVNDLITNTLGTAVGYLIALLIPRFVARPEYLRKRRRQARPVGVGRRLTGMLLDIIYFSSVWLVAMTVVSVAVFAFTGRPLMAEDATADPVAATAWEVAHLAVVMVVVVLPAFIGNGASLGQRTVYLQPHAKRWRLVARMLVVQGLVTVLGPLNLIALAGSMAWLTLAGVSVLFTRRGLSCVLTGCRLVDAREDAPSVERGLETDAHL